MGIEEKLTDRLKEAMRAKRADEVSVIRMVKTQATKDRTAPGFEGETDDEFWLGVIARYVKQQQRALAEFETIGDAAAEQIRCARWDIDYLTPFLPSLLGEEETEELVLAAIREIDAVGPKMVGRVVGAVMKAHKDKVDAGVVKRIASSKLG